MIEGPRRINSVLNVVRQDMTIPLSDLAPKKSYALYLLYGVGVMALAMARLLHRLVLCSCIHFIYMENEDLSSC